MAIEIVNVPIKNGGSFHSYLDPHDIPIFFSHQQNGGINSSASLRFYSMKFHLDLTATFVAAPWIEKKNAVFDEWKTCRRWLFVSALYADSKKDYAMRI